MGCKVSVVEKNFFSGTVSNIFIQTNIHFINESNIHVYWCFFFLLLLFPSLVFLSVFLDVSVYIYIYVYIPNPRCSGDHTHIGSWLARLLHGVGASTKPRNVARRLEAIELGFGLPLGRRSVRGSKGAVVGGGEYKEENMCR